MTEQLQAWKNRLDSIRYELETLYFTRLQCTEEYALCHAETTHTNLVGSSDAVRKANVELALAKSPVMTAATVSLGKVEAKIDLLKMERSDIRLMMQCEVAQVGRESVD